MIRDNLDEHGQSGLGGMRDETRMPRIVAGRFSVRSMAHETSESTLELWNPGCVDVLTPTARFDLI